MANDKSSPKGAEMTQDKRRSALKELTNVAWLKYTDYNGEDATSIDVCNPKDAGAFPVYGMSAILARESELVERVRKPSCDKCPMDKEELIKYLQEHYMVSTHEIADFILSREKLLLEKIGKLTNAISAIQMLIEEDIEERKGFTFNRKKMLDIAEEALK